MSEIGHRDWRRGVARLAAVAVLLLLSSGPAPAQFLYVNNNAVANSVSAFAVNLGTGALTPVAGSPFATGAAGNFTADIDSIAVCGNLLYASNGNGNSVSVFLIDESTGALTPALGSPFATGVCPTGLACTPDNARLYVGNFCAGTISIFDVTPTTGALAPNPASPFPLPIGASSPFDLELDAVGARLFVSQDLSNNVGVYDIALGGALTPVAGSPFSAGSNAHGGALRPDGAFYYVANLGSSIGAYAVGGGGALTPLAGSPFAFAASDLAMTPDGAFLLASSSSAGKLGVFAVNPVTGVPSAVAGSPFTADTASPAGMVSADGYVFVANGFFNAAASTVSAYKLNGLTGALTLVPGSPFARGVASAATGIAYHLPAVCGDGTVAAPEECDDGNTLSGDCCSATCELEANGSPCPDATLCNGDETCDGAGTCLAGSAPDCDDGNACTADSCDDLGGCVNDDTPHAGCLGSQKSLLLLKQNGGAKDKLVWKWLKGAALGTTQIGDPMTSASYALCVYAGGALVAGADIPAGSKWAPAAATGYLYTDVGAAPDGILKTLVKGGAAGKAKALVKGKGANLPDPALGSLALPVTAQLVNTTSGVCLEASYTTGNVISSGSGVFKAKK